MGWSHGKRWTEESIIAGIKDVIAFYELNRMPTRREVKEYCGHVGLAEAVTNRYGWYKLAAMLDLPIKDSDTTTGKLGESDVCKELEESGYSVERMVQNYPYDLLVNSHVKVDVKVSRLYHGPQGDFYTFNLEKKHPTCDVFILRCINDDKSLVKQYIIPSCVVAPRVQISLGVNRSKYDTYLNRWDILAKYDAFYNGVMQERSA